MSRLVSVGLAAVMSSCVLGADVDFEAYREAMERLLADERRWTDMVGFRLQKDRAGLEGYAVIDPKAETLIGFTERPAEPAVPMDVMAADNAVSVAEDGVYHSGCRSG